MNTPELPCNYNELHWTVRKQVREVYIKVQGGLCHHCKQPLTSNPPHEVLSKDINRKLFPHKFFEYPVHLHHDHNTGMTIGAVHNYCNAILWQYHGE